MRLPASASNTLIIPLFVWPRPPCPAHLPGMQQFLKMVGQQAGDDAAASKMASKLQANLDIQVLGPGGACADSVGSKASSSKAQPGRLKRGAHALNAWFRGVVAQGSDAKGVARRHTTGAQLDRPAGRLGLRGKASLGGSKSQQQQQQACVVAVYSFKYGIRKMTVTDTLRFRNGRIMRMRRAFKL